MKVLLNNVVLSSVPGNLKLVPNTNTFGPYMDGRSYTEGSVRTKKESILDTIPSTYMELRQYLSLLSSKQ